MNTFTLENNKNIFRRSISGGAWLAASYVAQKAIGIVSFLILARLLAPGEFGAMALTMIVPKFLGSISDTGFGTAIVQHRGQVEKYLNSIWTIGILKSISVFLLVAIFGGTIANFLKAEHLTNAIRLGGIFLIIQSLSNAGEVFFFRELDFRKLFIRNVFREITYTIVAIVSVFLLGPTYLALFTATLAAYTSQTISTYFLHHYRPRLSLHFRDLSVLTNYSKWIVLQGWCQQVYGLIESTGVARLTDITSMGYFSKAKSLAAVGPGFLSSILNPVSFSTYSKLERNDGRIHAGIIRAMNIISFFIIPLAFLVMTAAGKLIMIAVGPAWLPMTNAFRILFLFYAVNVVNDLVVNISNAMGKPKSQALISLGRLLIAAILILFLTGRYGIEGAAMSILAVGIITLLVNSVNFLFITSMPWRSLLHTISIPFFGSIIILIPALIWKERLLELSPFMFIMTTVLGGLVYCIVVIIGSMKTSYGHYDTLRKVITRFI